MAYLLPFIMPRKYQACTASYTFSTKDIQALILRLVYSSPVRLSLITGIVDTTRTQSSTYTPQPRDQHIGQSLPFRADGRSSILSSRRNGQRWKGYKLRRRL